MVTVKVYVAGPVRPLKVAIVAGPAPVMIEPPGAAVTVHAPVAGSPLKATLPVAVEQVGWVMVPTLGAEGVRLIVGTVVPGPLVQPFTVTVTE